MANVNISQVTLASTFDNWRVATNDLIQDRNLLRNYSYVKDESDFKIANGALRIARTNDGTLLYLEGSANAYIGGQLEAKDLLITGNAVVGNLTVNGTQTVVGTTVNDTDLIVLRSNTSTDGTVTIRGRRAGKGNAELYFDNTAEVWKSTANANVGYQTLLTTANITDSVTSTSTINAASPNSVKTAYDNSVVAANTVRVSQNGVSSLSAKQLNFINSASVLITVDDGAGAAAGNANIAFSVVGGVGAQGAQGVQGATGTGSPGPQGAQGVQGASGAATANLWIHKTATYDSANVYISASAPPSGNLKGDIWIQF